MIQTVIGSLCCFISTVLCICGLHHTFKSGSYDDIDSPQTRIVVNETSKRMNKVTDECIICYQEFEEGEIIITLQCDHYYHMNCINKWIQVREVCPQCQSPVNVMRVTC
jgi:hypothetical protein